MKLVKEILKNKAVKEVFSVTPESLVFNALTLLAEKNIGALMVIDKKGKVVGIFSERDYTRKVILKGKSSKETKVQDIMTSARAMYKIKPETDINECMVLMTGKHIRHLPVFDGQKFIGLISIGDILKAVIVEKEKLIDDLSDYIAGKYA
ncbi:MAG: CBS domain-containing protein [Deltaproteobacteria bacterium]|nr:CBS domain-containing protein [Deltaproteobacteria bacterium]